LLRLRNPYDHFAGLRALEFFAGNALYCTRIGFQGFDVVAELHVLGIKPVDVLADAFDLVLRAAHGDKPVRAENVVNDQRQHEQAKDGASVLLQKFVKPVLRAFVRYASTHLVASSVRRLEAFGLSAST
jgi:hypothetical protein